MDKIKQLAAELQSHVTEINSEIESIESKGKIQYGHSKRVRGAAMEAVRVSKDIRMAILSAFKAGKSE